MMMPVYLPLSTDSWATLHLPRYLTEYEWNRLLLILETMKPGLVQPQGEPVNVDDARQPEEL